MKSVSALLVLILSGLRCEAQISGAGSLGCPPAPVTGTAWTSATALNTTQVIANAVGMDHLIVELVQTSTLTAGAVTFQGDYGSGTMVDVPAGQLVTQDTIVRIANPYTLQASTNKIFLVQAAGMYKIQLKLTTAITGTGSITPYTTAVCQTYPVSTNFASILGTAISVNSGTADAGTIRTILPTNQPAIPASQSGTWTVQPGNTANTTAWLVTGTGGTFPATQSGTWTVQPGNTANTTPWLATINQGGNSATVSAGGALKVDGSAATQPVSGTVTADTELPAAAALADAASATPSTSTVGAIHLLMNATTVDRQRAVVNALDSTGTGIAAAGLVGQLDDTATGTVTENQFAPVRISTRRALLVEGVASGTALPVSISGNQAVNVAQINGVTPLMGNGVTGTGSQRVTIASDNTAFAVNATLSAETTKVIGTVRNLGNAGAAFDAATGAAPPANAVLLGGLGSGATGGFLTAIPVCDTFYNINIVTATTTLAVTGVSGRHVRICHIHMMAAGTQNVGIISGTGATCGTGTGAIVGTTAATGYNLTTQTGIAAGSGIGTVMRTVATGDSVCIISSAAVQLSGVIAYTIY